jgi:TIR domain-containing protein
MYGRRNRHPHFTASIHPCQAAIVHDAPQTSMDAFLSHSHDDATWVEALARRLEDECKFKVWLDKWVLVPGKSWQQAMARGLEDARSCAVFIGANTPRGWFQQEIERALDLQTRNADFRVIPVLMPDADLSVVPAFLSLRTWADFRDGQDKDYALHVLRQGIKGEPVGRWPRNDNSEGVLHKYGQRIVELAHFRSLGVHEEVIIEFERKILDKWLDEGPKT